MYDMNGLAKKKKKKNSSLVVEKWVVYISILLKWVWEGW